MNNTDKKILFFDIDGTLLTPPPFSVPESTVIGLKKAQAQGHLTFVNTGRIYGIIPDNIKALGFDGYVCGCGSQIYLHDELLFLSVLPNKTCREIVQLLRDCRISAFFEHPDGLLMDGLATARSETVEGLKKLIPAEDVSLYDSEKWHSFTFSKFLIVATPQSDMETFRDYCRDKFVMFDHGHGAFEVTQKKYSKATGIQFLLDHLGLPLENSFAFGDSNNDLPMLQYAGNSIAMGNCVEEILPFCTYQTTHINDNGIYNALSHFGLLG